MKRHIVHDSHTLQVCERPIRGGLAGLIFNPCNVLFDQGEWRRWLSSLLGRLNIDVEYGLAQWDDHFYCDVCCGRREFGEAFEGLLRSFGLTPSLIEEISAASQVRRQSNAVSRRPFPGVITTLARLQEQGLTLALVANAPLTGPQLAQVCRDLSISVDFKVVHTSFEMNRPLPHRDAYQAVVERLGLRAEQVAFVSHSAQELGVARDIGLRTIAYNHDASCRADRGLECFDELLTVVAEWSHAAAPTPR